MKTIQLLLVSSVIAAPAFAQYETGDTAGSAIESGDQPTPKMREVDRDWDYFKSISCADIHAATFHSRSEETLLARRKSECLNKYDAFMPKPIERK